MEYTALFLVLPKRFLLAVMGVSAALSAVLANDIVCPAFTPALCLTLLEEKKNQELP